jgi:hypothetical protein
MQDGFAIWDNSKPGYLADIAYELGQVRACMIDMALGYIDKEGRATLMGRAAESLAAAGETRIPRPCWMENENQEPDHVCEKQEDADTVFKSITQLSAAINELLDKVQSMPQYAVNVEPGLTGHDIIVTVRQKAKEPDHV